jgi:hypothetical protein
MDLNSIERIQEYSNLPTEKGLENEDLCDSRDANYGHSAGGNNNEERGVEMSRLAGSDRLMDSSQHPLMALQQAVGTKGIISVGSGRPTDVDGAWPNEGRVEFRNIVLKYTSCATPVLR